MTKLPISVCLVAGNEAHRIRAALDSVKGWTAEIILAIDDKVTDGTGGVGAEYGARVVSQRWAGHAAHRNFASSHATQPWLLAIDADEVISDGLRAEIMRAFESHGGGPPPAAYSFPRLSFFCGRWIRHGDWYPDRKVRLWRGEAGQWEGDPHERLELRGRVFPLRGDLLHYSNENIDQFLNKMGYISSVFVRQRHLENRRAGWGDLCFRPFWKFFRAYVVRLGFLDGWPGYLIAWANAFSTVVRYAKVMEADLPGKTGAGDAESRAIWDFFKRNPHGVFVEVGANHPTRGNQTWYLEEQGWTGVLVEPNPELHKLLCGQRPRSRAVHAAVGAPGQAGEVDLLLGVDDLHSTLAPVLGDPLSGKKVRVKLRTLDSILDETGTAQIDFLSVDVEGMELAVLQGLDMQRRRPALILIEEHRRDYRKHFYLRRQGYRLVKRTGRNNWYVPRESPATVGSLNTMAETLRLWRKMWLNPPFDNLKRKLAGLFTR